MESCHLDADLDYESIPIFTQKESLEAFLPSRVVALVNVVELIDQFAMTPKEAAVEAAREGNVERVRCFLDDLDFDIASVVTTAAEYGQNEVIDMIRSNTLFIDAAKHGCLQTVEWFNSYNRASRESITAHF
ncbi:hypothetical protein JG687_00007994 [Phytophthora cactorum]|uniref:Ankyrin repeat-containing domain n=1 Tax=Phytophthora cactorum TaxID=29920 RepID=A0A8T1UFY5_9STRA|nr:hypothetical protein JG687_00007994 [Phytophthora cactorum]